MQEINLQEILFNSILNDYYKYKKNNDYQAQFLEGIDFLESVIKFFAAINISTLKQIDEEKFNDVFNEHFRYSPSLGSFKSLATESIINNKYTKNLFYKKLVDLFEKERNIELYDINEILKGNKKKIEKSKLKLKNIFGYIVTFRNKFKGHGASFKNNDNLKKILLDDSVDILVTKFKEILEEEFFNDEKLQFKTENGFLYLIYDNQTVDILPIMLLFDCEQYTCHNKQKIFFFNDKGSSIYFLDYIFSHFHIIKKEKEKIYSEISKYLTKHIINSSDYEREQLLLSDFVGREEEIDKVVTHINQNRKNKTFTFIVGKPGVGKSALVTKIKEKLDSLIKEKKPKYKTYIYYAKRGYTKDEKSGSEYQRIFEKLKKYFSHLEIYVNECKTIEELLKAYDYSKNPPFVFIIDGFDEFENPFEIIEKLPVGLSNKTHWIFTSRDENYLKKDDIDRIQIKKIKDEIKTKILSKKDSLKIFKENLFKEKGYSLELGGLEEKAARGLIESYLPKKELNTNQIDEIVDIIIEKTQCLPLYITYLLKELKRKNIKKNIPQKLIEWANQLPVELYNFYEKKFESIYPESRKILVLLYFLKYGAKKEEIFYLINDLWEIDEFEFSKFFAEIEIFLKVTHFEKREIYDFYHISVKEAIEKFLETESILTVLDNEVLKEILFLNSNEKIIYLNEYSYYFKFLVKIIDNLKKYPKLFLYKTNFFYLYYQYIHFRIYQEILGFKDVKQKNYEKLLDYTRVGKEIKKLINDFFERFDSKENKYLYEIRYAYNLAFLVEDYERVLKYMDMYQNYIYDEFLDIAMNIDKIEYIQKFIELKDDWINNIPKELKDFYVEIMAKKEKLPDEFTEVMKFLEDETFIYLLVHLIKFYPMEEIIEKISNIFVNCRYKDRKEKLFLILCNQLSLMNDSIAKNILLSLKSIINYHKYLECEEMLNSIKNKKTFFKSNSYKERLVDLKKNIDVKNLKKDLDNEIQFCKEEIVELNKNIEKIDERAISQQIKKLKKLKNENRIRKNEVINQLKKFITITSSIKNLRDIYGLIGEYGYICLLFTVLKKVLLLKKSYLQDITNSIDEILLPDLIAFSVKKLQTVPSVKNRKLGPDELNRLILLIARDKTKNDKLLNEIYDKILKLNDESKYLLLGKIQKLINTDCVLYRIFILNNSSITESFLYLREKYEKNE